MIDVGNFYVTEMKARLAKAEAKEPPDVTQKEIAAAYDDFRACVEVHFSAFKNARFVWDNDDRESFTDMYSFDCKVILAHGIAVAIDQDRLDQRHPWLAPRALLIARRDKRVEACKKSCEIRDLLETKVINAFKAYARAAKAKPSREDCEQLLKDFLALRGHTCPV